MPPFFPLTRKPARKTVLCSPYPLACLQPLHWLTCLEVFWGLVFWGGGVGHYSQCPSAHWPVTGPYRNPRNALGGERGSLPQLPGLDPLTWPSHAALAVVCFLPFSQKFSDGEFPVFFFFGLYCMFIFVSFYFIYFIYVMETTEVIAFNRIVLFMRCLHN